MIKDELGDIALGIPLSAEGKVTHGISNYSGLGPGGELVQESNFDDDGADGESGFLALGALSLYRQTYCKRLCRSLGYEKKEKLGGDKRAFLKCKSECLINFKAIKKKRYKIIPASPADPEVDLDLLDKETSAETGVKPTAADVERAPSPTPAELAPEQKKSKTMMYVIIGVVLLLVIVGAVIMMRKKAA
jgi:hypothetical protein